MIRDNASDFIGMSVGFAAAAIFINEATVLITAEEKRPKKTAPAAQDISDDEKVRAEAATALCADLEEPSVSDEEMPTELESRALCFAFRLARQRVATEGALTSALIGTIESELSDPCERGVAREGTLTPEGKAVSELLDDSLSRANQMIHGAHTMHRRM